MTVGNPIQSMGAREAREDLRVLLARIEEGEGPFLILRDAQPMALMIRYDEAERWQRIDRALWHLHGMRIFPEVARGTVELEAIVRGDQVPSTTQMRAWDTSHDIGWVLRPIGLTDARMKFAELLDEISSGRPRTIVNSGRLAATLIRPMEYDRLMSLSRTVAWFKMHGLDLANTTDEASYDWLQEFRTDRRPAAAEDEGSATA